MKILFRALVILTLATIQSYGQGPWNKKKGEGFVKLSQTILKGNQFFDSEGELKTITGSGIYITSIYTEYGISDRLTAVAYVPFFRSVLNERQLVNSGILVPGDESNSLGDVNLSLQYGILNIGPFVLSSSLTLGLPIGQTAGGETMLLQSGDGEFNQLLKVHAGYSFHPVPVYALIGVGFNNRTNDFSDEFHANFEAGVTIKKSITAAIKLYNLSSFNNGDGTATQSGIFSNNLEYFAFGPSIAYTHNDKFGVSADIQGAFSGQNILAEPSINFGLFYKF